MGRLRFIAGVLLTLFVSASINTASATTLEYALANNYHGPGTDNDAGFVFTNPVDRFLVDFLTGDVTLSFEALNANLANVHITGSALGSPELGVPNPGAPEFYSMSGLYTFDFAFVVIREDADTFVNPVQTNNIGTITNPLGVTETLNAQFNPAGQAFVLNFSDDLSTISGAGWVRGPFTGDFHFTGSRIIEPTEVPEPASCLLLGSSLLGLLHRRRKGVS